MPMYNFLEYYSNYSDTTDIFWFYSKDEGTHFNADIEKNVAFKPFVCKTKLVGRIEAQTTPDNKYRFLKMQQLLYVVDWLQSWIKT